MFAIPKVFTCQVFLILGSPCAGKTFLIKNNFKENDILIDLDSLKSSLQMIDTHCPCSEQTLKFAWDLRDYALELLCNRRQPHIRRAWIISCNHKLEFRDNIRAMGGKIYVIESNLEVCMQRLNADPQNRNSEIFAGLIKDFHENFEESPYDIRIESGATL